MAFLKQVKHGVAQAAQNFKRYFAVWRGNQGREGTSGERVSQQPRLKKIILGLIVGASIVVVASWAVFAIKPTWWAPVRGLIISPQASKKKKTQVQRPPKSVPKTVKTRKTTTGPPTTPESGQQPKIASRMERPQTTAPKVPPATTKSSDSPNTRPQVSIPGGPDGSDGSGGDQGPAVTPPAPAPLLTPKKEESALDEYLEIGTIYAQKGDYQNAEKLFQRVTTANPSSAQARNNLGFVYLKQEKYEQAEREFKEALRINPAFVLPYYNLACLYSRKGMNVEALIYLKRALNRDARVKGWAAIDDDFARLRTDVVFQELVGISPPQATATYKQEEVEKDETMQKQESTQRPELLQKQEEAQREEEVQQQAGAHRHEEKQLQTDTLKQEGAPQQERTQKPAKTLIPKRIPIPMKTSATSEPVQTQEGTQGQ